MVGRDGVGRKMKEGDDGEGRIIGIKATAAAGTEAAQATGPLLQQTWRLRVGTTILAQAFAPLHLDLNLDLNPSDRVL